MRLLDTTTFELKDFIGSNIPKYAILSHTWDNDEILFEDLAHPTHIGGAMNSWMGKTTSINGWRRKKAFIKLNGFCRKAQTDGFKWCWIDTCCINKSSSAELSEAINSMYLWYKSSQACYVYLADVEMPPESTVVPSSFALSRWFTRGWTLQELLAPSDVTFYDSSWREVGTKKDLSGEISHATGVRRRAFLDPISIPFYTVAERMSWAAKRVTTREEDIAYCLLGIFGVNMPMLYGEGSRAFLRLQEQILNTIDDYTVFAWRDRSEDPSSHRRRVTGILAESPLDFQNPSSSFDGSKVGLWNYSDLESRMPYQLNVPFRVEQSDTSDSDALLPASDEPPRFTPRGIRITMPFVHQERTADLLVFISCVRIPEEELVCLALEDGSNYHPAGNQFGRRAYDGLVFLKPTDISLEYKTIYISRTPALTSDMQVGMLNPPDIYDVVLLGTSGGAFIKTTKCTRVRDDDRFEAVCEWGGIWFWVLFGYDTVTRWCDLLPCEQAKDISSLWSALMYEAYKTDQSCCELVLNSTRPAVTCTITRRTESWVTQEANLRRFKDNESQILAIKAHRLYYVELGTAPNSHNTTLSQPSTLLPTYHELSFGRDLRLLALESFYSPDDFRNPRFNGRPPLVRL